MESAPPFTPKEHTLWYVCALRLEENGPSWQPFTTTFQIPWFESPIIYDVRAKPRNIASLTGTKGESGHKRSILEVVADSFGTFFADLQMVCCVEQRYLYSADVTFRSTLPVESSLDLRWPTFRPCKLESLPYLVLLTNIFITVTENSEQITTSEYCPRS